MSAGFRIRPMPPALSVAEREKFADFEASQLADCTGRIQAAGSRLVPRHNGSRLVGRAVTVRTRPGDHLMVQKALDLAREGDVIVVDGGGFDGQALVGEIMARLAMQRGLSGFVIDGAVRDVEFLITQSLPVYSTSVCPRGPTRVGPGEINVGVCIAGMYVHPGDILVGDSDGVVSIHMDEVDAVLAAADILRSKEEAMLRGISTGEIDRSWVDAALRAGGGEFHEEK